MRRCAAAGRQHCCASDYLAAPVARHGGVLSSSGRAAGVRVPGCAQRRAGDGDAPDPAVQVAALVVALEQALAAARCLLASVPVPFDGPMVMRGAARLDGLSRREGEVLRLLTVGRSNREIAAALFLSPRTVQRHVANVYLKIGAHNKADATAYALRHGLG